jgi:hypothetical protein
MMPGACCTVLYESAAIGTFLLNFRADDPVPAVAWANGVSLRHSCRMRRLISQPQECLNRQAGRALTRVAAAKLLLVPAGGTWGHSGEPTEVPRKVAVVRKARGHCDLGQRQFGIVKHVLGGFDASPQEIAVRWQPNRLPECVREIVY